MNKPLSGLTLAVLCMTGVSIRGPSTALRASPSTALRTSADDDLSALKERADRLEALTERVEALSAIKRLQHAYGHYSELGLWHDFADLFADTGIAHTTRRARSTARGFARSS